MANSIASLGSTSVNDSSPDFLFMRNLMLPAYNDIFNQTKISIHYTFVDIF